MLEELALRLCGNNRRGEVMYSDAIDFDDTPPFAPPSEDERERDDCVAFLLYEFEQAASGEHAAWAMSGAICRLQNADRRLPITPRQRDSLLRALFSAYRRVVKLFDATVGRAPAAHGFDAVAGLIILWSETAEERAARPKISRKVVDSYARILRNECHNLSLLDELARDAVENHAVFRKAG